MVHCGHSLHFTLHFSRVDFHPADPVKSLLPLLPAQDAAAVGASVAAQPGFHERSRQVCAHGAQGTYD